jgi:hypothetical protein
MKTPYSQEEIEYLKNNFMQMSYKEIAKKIGRSTNSVRQHCSKMNFRKQVDDWSPKEVEYLCNEYSKENLNLDEISKNLNRLKSNVCKKARKLGLTDVSRPKSKEHIKKMQQNAINWLKLNEHPKGNLGNKHSKKYSETMSKKIKALWNNSNSVYRTEQAKQKHSDNMMERQREGKMRQGYSRGSMGKRDDLGGLYVRSSWEANYARYLNWLVEQKQIIKWEYEPDVFEFTNIKRGCRSYLPDFKIYNLDGTIEYHEVKGWMDQKSKTKLSRMAKYYKEIKLLVIGKEEYYAIRNDVKPFIPNWE